MSRGVRKENLIQIPLTQGMDQGPDERMGQLGSLKRVRNMRAVAGGFLRKRVGCTTFSGSVPSFAYPLVSSTVRVKPTLLSRVGDANVVGITSGAVFALDETAGGTGFQYVGRHSTASPVRARGALIGGDLSGTTEGFGRSPSAIAINSTGYVLVASVTDGNVVHAFVESPDGVKIWRGASITASKVQCLCVGALMFLIYQNGTDISAVRFTPSSAGITYELGLMTDTVATLTGASAYWDTSAYDGTNWYIVYQNGAAQCTVARMADRTAAATRTFAVTGTVPLAITAMTSMSAANAIWVGYYDDPTVTGNVGYLVMSASLGATTLAKTTIRSGANSLGPPLFGPYYDRETPDADAAFYVHRGVEIPGNVSARLVWAGVQDAAGAAVLSEFRAFHYIPVSKPDSYMRVWCLHDVDSANFQLAQYALLRFERLREFAGISRPWVELATRRFPAMGTTYGPSAKADFFHALAIGAGTNDATSRALYALPLALNTVSNVPLAAIETYEYKTAEFSPSRAKRPVAGALVFGGSPSEIYGQTVNALYTTAAGNNMFAALGGAELGWPHAPTVIDSSTTGGNVEAGARTYKLVYEWSDVYGRRHLSAPSAPFSVTLSSASQVTLNTIDANVGQRQFGYVNVAPPRLLAYRLVLGGGQYKRVPGSVVAFDNTDGKVAFVDNYTDDTIRGNETLYTDGGVFPNVLAPSCQFFTLTENRLVLGGLWDPTVVHFSKEFVPGEPICFSEDPSFQVPLFADVTGLSYMDGATVAFTRDSILIITGEGPNDQGQGGFSTRYLTKELGCVDYKSIVETNVGIVFLSADGYYLLPRGFGPPQAVGNAVRKDVHSGAAQRCLASAAVTSEQTADGAGGSTYAVWLTEREDAGAALDAAASGATTAGAGAATNPTGIAAAAVNHTLGDGVSRMVLVAVGIEVGSSFGYVPGSATATYGGVSMTLVREYVPLTNPSTIVIALFGLLEDDLPAAGVNAVSVRVTTLGTPSGSTQGLSIGVASYESVKQVFPATFAETLVSSVTSVSQSLAISLGAIGVDVVLCTGSNGTKTADSGQSERVDITTVGHFGVSDKENDGDAAQSMGWSFTNTQNTVLHLAFALDQEPNSLLIWDTESGQWFTDLLADRMAEIGAWSDGLALCTEDLDSDTEAAPLRYMNDITKATDDGATYISARVESPVYHPFGLGGWGSLKQVAVSFVGSNFDLHLDVRVNGGDWQTEVFTIASGDDDAVSFRYVTPATQKCSTFEYRIYDAENEGDDVSFGLLGVALEVDDSGGLRPVEEGERA